MNAIQEIVWAAPEAESEAADAGTQTEEKGQLCACT